MTLIDRSCIIPFMEYTIRVEQAYVIFTTKVVMTKDLYYATRFRSKEKAIKIAKKVNGVVEVYYGSGMIHGSKGDVSPKQSPINRNSPDRSI